MDVERIRGAFRERFETLRRRDPALTLAAIAERMKASTKTVDNLVNDRPKSSFSLVTLRDASRALEWPEDALERIEAGDVEPNQLDEVAWTDEAEDRIARLEASQEKLAEELESVHEELRELRTLFVQALRPDDEGRG